MANAGWGDVRRRRPDATWEVVAAGLSEPRSLRVSADGGLTLLEAGSRLVHLGADGGRKVLASGLSGAYAALPAPDGDGHLVTETARHRIVRVRGDGSVTPYLEQQLATPRAVRPLADGAIAVVDGGGRVVRIAPDGGVEVVASGLGSGLHGLAVDGAGNLYTGDAAGDRILRIDPGGGVAVAATTPFPPGAVAWSGQDGLLVAPLGGRSVYAVDGAGHLALRWSLGTPVGGDMVADAAGGLWGLGSSATELFHVAAGGTEDRYPLAARSAGLQLDG
ncbi:MAG: hypothetical protein D6739_00705, partial [Nitrospirae bacterium]